MRIGVDTGGTFTDCVVLEDDDVKILKVFSTPDDAARAILEGVGRLASRALPKISARRRTPAPFDIIHGTTVGTNSLLERRGARVALVTTAGFEDLLVIGRQSRPSLYDFNVQREPPLVRRELRFGAKERVSADGKILLRLSQSELTRLKRRVKRSGANSIAVCFLFSFANPENERAVVRALRDLGLPLSASHEILPEFREYERLSTVVINAFLAPKMSAYLADLERRLQTGSLFAQIAVPAVKARRAGANKANSRIYVMQSSGGITSATEAARKPVHTILSGPAGGVAASAWLAQELGIARAICFDMGGTSTDVCLLDGKPRTTSETTLAGLPVAVPVLDVHSVGAGGGSLARMDAGGALRVGPESAGARPGPICYGQGGARPTVTDANLLLGRLDADHFLGGGFRLDYRAAWRGFENFLHSSPRDGGFRTPRDLASGIVAVSNAIMEKALRVISVERGYDPRDFTLICYGGAGGLHAADLARSLQMPQVIVPRNPGAFSALGILLSDIVKDAVRSVLLLVPPTGESSLTFHGISKEICTRFDELDQAARAELRREGFAAERARAEKRLDLRYQGQSYELSVPFTARFREHFHHEHQKAYGCAHVGRSMEVVNLRLRLVIRTPKPRIHGQAARTAHPPRAAVVKKKPVWFNNRPLTTPLYDRERLPPGARVVGPAVMVEYSSTTVVPPDFVCRVDRDRNLVLTRH
jgi:N-methylhydantoinase A